MNNIINPSRISFASSFGYLQSDGVLSVSATMPSQSVPSFATVYSSGAISVPGSYMVSPRLKFSFDSDYILSNNSISILDVNALTPWVRGATVKSSNGNITLDISSFNRSASAQTLPSFTVTAEFDIIRAPYEP